MRSIERHLRDDGPRWWSPFLAGAAAGLLAGVLLRGKENGDAESRLSRMRDAWTGAVEGAQESLSNARELVLSGPELDIEHLRDRVEHLECAAECRVRVLGDGIVEVVGSCASEDDLRVLLDALAAEPGVEVVVNRAWTPESSG